MALKHLIFHINHNRSHTPSDTQLLNFKQHLQENKCTKEQFNSHSNHAHHYQMQHNSTQQWNTGYYYGDNSAIDTTSRALRVTDDMLTDAISATLARSHTSRSYCDEPKFSTIVIIGNEKMMPQNTPRMSENAAIMPATPLCLSATFLQQPANYC